MDPHMNPFKLRFAHHTHFLQLTTTLFFVKNYQTKQKKNACKRHAMTTAKQPQQQFTSKG